MYMIEPLECNQCGTLAGWNEYCGCFVCNCGNHFRFGSELDRCYCGWARDGGDGRQQLADYGENVDDRPEGDSIVAEIIIP